MIYYFDSLNRLTICGSDKMQMREDIEERYIFDGLDLPLGIAFSNFLNLDIDKWWENLDNLLLDIINNYDDNKDCEYMDKAINICSIIPYFLVYNELFYNEIFTYRGHPKYISKSSNKVKSFFEGEERDDLLKINKYKYRGEIERLKDLQKLFTDLSLQCLSPNIQNPLKILYDNQEKLLNHSRYILRSNVDTFGSTSISRFEFNEINQEDYEAVEVHFKSDVYDICQREFISLVNNKSIIKKCDNIDCGKYFIPENRIDTIYCNDCKNKGIAMRKYQKRIQGDPLLSIYNKVYQSKYAKMVKPYSNHPVMKKKKLKELKLWRDEAKMKIARIEYLDDEEKKKEEIDKLIEWIYK